MKKIILVAFLSLGLFGIPKSSAQSTPFLGQIIPVAFNFAPQGWAQCNGQLMSIAQNQALFSLLGTQYGGDGQTTFALPDLRGREILGAGQGSGLSNVSPGDKAGSESNTISLNTMPAHFHTIFAAGTTVGLSSNPIGNVPNISGALDKEYIPASAANSSMASTGIAGGGQPVNNMKPYIPVFYIIATQGIFPSQN